MFWIFFFYEESNGSGLDSVGVDGPAIFAYRGNTLDPIALREEAHLEVFINWKFVLHTTLCNFCLS